LPLFVFMASVSMDRPSHTDFIEGRFWRSSFLGCHARADQVQNPKPIKTILKMYSPQPPAGSPRTRLQRAETGLRVQVTLCNVFLANTRRFLQVGKSEVPPDSSGKEEGTKHVHAEGRRPGSPPEGTGRVKPPLGAKSTSP